MTKRFCDLCGEPATKELVGISLTIKGKVLSDKSAQVQVRLGLGFVNHSTGFGGPPDLCSECLNDIVSKLAKHIASRP